ncbi:MAG: 1-acyl-sn-glycerol-3-phosphate acyltransferase [Spirochaetota bacterium]
MSKDGFFIPARMHYPTLWAIDFSMPLILKTALNIDGIMLSESDKVELRKLKKKRVLFLSNHPTTFEPPVTYQISNIMGSRFHFMASRNVFNWGFGMVGEIISRIGAFSVLAGGSDKESLKTARKVLSSPEGKLAIYPEGMTGGENDNLVPFMPGITQIGFWALDDLRKQGSQEEIIVLPTFVKYVLSASAKSQERDIELSLRRIERKLKINPSDKNILRRFLTIGRILLEKTETEYHIKVKDKEDYDYRIGHLRHIILNTAAEKLGFSFAENRNAIEKLRELFTISDSFEAGAYDKRKYGSINPDYLQSAKKEIQLAYLFLVLKPEYILSYPSAERLMEWLYRFETIVLGETQYRARKAYVKVGNYFPLNEYYEEYKKNKKKVVEGVTQRLRKEIEQKMQESLSLTSPLFNPYDVGSGTPWNIL